MNQLTIGQRIASRRKLLNLSQEALSEQLSVSRQAVSKWESDAAIPEIDKIIALGKIFDVSVGWLLGVESESDAGFTEEQLQIVEKLIAKLAKPETPVLRCYNKADLVYPEDIPNGNDVVAISAKRGMNMDGLLKAIEKALDHARHHIIVCLPYSMGGMVETLHNNAQVLNVDYTAGGIEVETIVDDILYGRLRDHIALEL